MTTINSHTLPEGFDSIEPLSLKTKDQERIIQLAISIILNSYTERKSIKNTSDIIPGYKFQKLDVRGKVFIEYVPIEKSWLPLKGSNFMVINCFWVACRLIVKF